MSTAVGGPHLRVRSCRSEGRVRSPGANLSLLFPLPAVHEQRHRANPGALPGEGREVPPPAKVGGRDRVTGPGFPPLGTRYKTCSVLEMLGRL